jgi:exodeoxyribonuclease VII large subunit
VPDTRACLEALGRTAQRLDGGMRRELRVSTARLQALDRRLQLAHPGIRLQQHLQRLDDLAQRLTGATRALLHRDGRRLAESHGRLLQRSPHHLLGEWSARNQTLQLRLARATGECVTRCGARTEALGARLERAVSQRVTSAAHRLALAQRALDAVSPLATLTRGFAIVTRADGTLVRDAAAVADGEEIEARLARGALKARVTGRR